MVNDQPSVIDGVIDEFEDMLVEREQADGPTATERGQERASTARAELEALRAKASIAETYDHALIEIRKALGLSEHDEHEFVVQQAAALRAKAERASDCELIVRLNVERERQGSRATNWVCFSVVADGQWRVEDVRTDRIIDTGPIVSGIPILTPKARAAIEAAVERREG